MSNFGRLPGKAGGLLMIIIEEPSHLIYSGFAKNTIISNGKGSNDT